MIGIVVSGHILFASGMASAVRAIVGEQEQIAFIDFEETMSTDALESALRQAGKDVNSGDGVLFLTDIPGGSPCNRAMNIMMGTGEPMDAELLTGVNLPMIINACFEREEAESLAQLSGVLLEIGASTMQNMRHQFFLAQSENKASKNSELFEAEGL